jgi:uncharacterized protein (DUF1800 family)
MELHPLGVDGGYSQRDVTEVAVSGIGEGLEVLRIREPATARFISPKHLRKFVSDDPPGIPLLTHIPLLEVGVIL